MSEPRKWPHIWVRGNTAWRHRTPRPCKTLTERAILGICACSKPEADQNRARTLSSEPTSHNNTQTDVKQSTHRSRWQRQQRTPTPACVIGMRSVRGFGGRAYEFEIRKHRSRWKHTRDQFMASECQQQRSQRGSTLGVGWGSGNKNRRLATNHFTIPQQPPTHSLQPLSGAEPRQCALFGCAAAQTAA